MPTFVYITFIGLAFLSSLIAPGDIRPRYVIVFNIALALLLIIEICANYFLRSLGLTTNAGLYDIAMLVEFWGYAFYFYAVMEGKLWKRLLAAYLILFPVFWVAIVFVIPRTYVWNSPLSVVGSMAIIIMSVRVYYQLFTANEPIRLFVNFDFLVATALIIFFAGNFFYLGMLNSLWEKHKVLSKRLLLLLQIQNIILYSTLIYAFICLRFANKRERRLDN